MSTQANQANKDIILSAGELFITKNLRDVLKATRVATSIVVTLYDPSSRLGGMVHMALPDSQLARHPGDSELKYVDLALPKFIAEMLEKGMAKSSTQVKIIGGSQLFNFGSGGNILNVGTRNTITVRTILTREGLQIEKTETGGNKLRTVTLDMSNGTVQVCHPGEMPRTL